MMKRYSYKGMGPNNQWQEGIITAESLAMAHQTLRQRHIRPIACSRKFLSFNFRNLSQQRLLFFRSLQDLLKAHLKIHEAIQALADMLPSSTLKEASYDMSRRIYGGENFSVALAAHPYLFDPLTCQLVAVAEQTGRLEAIISDLADHYQGKHDTTKKLKRSLLYPFLVLFVFLIGLIVFFTQVQPELTNFQQMLQNKPTPHSLPSYLSYLSFFGMLGLLLGSKKAIYHPRIQEWFFALPYFGPNSALLCLKSWLHALHLCLHSRQALLRSLYTASPLLRGNFLKQRAANIAKDLEQGSSFSETFSRHFGFLPSTILVVLAASERSGNLVEGLGFIDRWAQSHAANKIDQLCRFLPLLALLGVGLAMSLAIWTSFLPLFQFEGFNTLNFIGSHP